jgi:hypothetical protein
MYSVAVVTAVTARRVSAPCRSALLALDVSVISDVHLLTFVRWVGSVAVCWQLCWQWVDKEQDVVGAGQDDSKAKVPYAWCSMQNSCLLLYLYFEQGFC